MLLAVIMARDVYGSDRLAGRFLKITAGLVWYGRVGSQILEIYFCVLFTALHVMQTRYSDENYVRPSVRLSVTRVIPDKMEERSVQIYIPYERTFILVF